MGVNIEDMHVLSFVLLLQCILHENIPVLSCAPIHNNDYIQTRTVTIGFGVRYILFSMLMLMSGLSLSSENYDMGRTCNPLSRSSCEISCERGANVLR